MNLRVFKIPLIICNYFIIIFQNTAHSDCNGCPLPPPFHFVCLSRFIIICCVQISCFLSFFFLNKIMIFFLLFICYLVIRCLYSRQKWLPAVVLQLPTSIGYKVSLNIIETNWILLGPSHVDFINSGNEWLIVIQKPLGEQNKIELLQNPNSQHHLFKILNSLIRILSQLFLKKKINFLSFSFPKLNVKILFIWNIVQLVSFLVMYCLYEYASLKFLNKK